jgi:Mrp family chromosome partitioning ATPase
MSIVEKSLKRAQDAARGRVGLGDTRSSPSEVAQPADVGLELPPPQRTAFPKLIDARLDLLARIDDHDVLSIRGRGVTRLAGQMRTLKLNALERVAHVQSTGLSPVMLITSALPGDGKSFVSLNLALSLARERSLHVTLVDGDLARRRISRLFGAESMPGLIDWLEAPQSGLPSIYSTAVERLTLLPAGSCRAEEADVLSPDLWTQLIAKLRQMGPKHLVIADSAPILATGDAQFLAASSDLILFVIRALQTPVPSINEAVGRLGDPSKLACVVNGSPLVDDSYSDYYGSDVGSGQAK